MFIVQEYVAGKWHTVDRHDTDKPEPRLFDTRTEAMKFAERLNPNPGKVRIKPVTS